MGVGISSQNGNASDAPLPRKLFASSSTDPITQGRKLSWFPAGDTTSVSFMNYRGSVWLDSSRDSRPDTYQNVTAKIGESMLKEKLQQLSQKNISAVSKNHSTDDQGSICFYGYSFNNGRQTVTTSPRFDLAEQREILGVANLQGPLAWYPIGKNRIESLEDESSVCLMFARPEHVIIRLTIDSAEVGNTRCPGSGPPCFLSLPMKDCEDLTHSKKFPIYVTHVDHMNVGQPEPYTSACADAFGAVMKNLSPGTHQCHITIQFAYKPSKVTAIALKQLELSSSPKLKRGCVNATEVFDFSLRQTVRNSSLVLRHSNPSKVILSPTLCSGHFSVVIPQIQSFESFDHYNFQSCSASSNHFDRQIKDNRMPKSKQKAKRRRFSSG